MNKVYNALALPPILLYGSENWTLRKKYEKRLTLIRMKIFRSAGYTPFDLNKIKKFWKS